MSLNQSDSEQQKISYITSIINQYLQLRNEIKELQKAIKERKYKCKLLEESILTFMNEDDSSIDSIKLSNNDHEIIPIQKEQVKEVSRKNLMVLIEKHLKDKPEILENIKKDIDSKKITTKIEKIKVKKTSTKIKPKTSKVSEDSNESDKLLGL
jgi:hypothetical protein